MIPMGVRTRNGRINFLFKTIIPKIKEIKIIESLLSKLNPLNSELSPITKNASRNDNKSAPKIECVNPRCLEI